MREKEFNKMQEMMNNAETDTKDQAFCKFLEDCLIDPVSHKPAVLASEIQDDESWSLADVTRLMQFIMQVNTGQKGK